MGFIQVFSLEDRDKLMLMGYRFLGEQTIGKTQVFLFEYHRMNFDKKDFEKIWYDYFDLSLDYGKIRNEISRLHPVLCEAAKYAPGIRILRQEPYEALCTFIISQNNNIPRISGIIVIFILKMN